MSSIVSSIVFKYVEKYWRCSELLFCNGARADVLTFLVSSPIVVANIGEIPLLMAARLLLNDLPTLPVAVLVCATMVRHP